VIIALAAITGALFGASIVSILVAIGVRKGACGDCAAWERAATICTEVAADLERQLDLLIGDEMEEVDEFPWQ
jgi:hypothetical protein